MSVNVSIANDLPFQRTVIVLTPRRPTRYMTIMVCMSNGECALYFKVQLRAQPSLGLQFYL